MRIDTLDHLVLTVRDVETSCAFYETMLGMRTGAEGPILSVYCRDPDGNLIEIANRLPA